MDSGKGVAGYVPFFVVVAKFIYFLNLKCILWAQSKSILHVWHAPFPKFLNPPIDLRYGYAQNGFRFTGDKRVNEQVALMSIHTIFHRYHNDIEER